MALDFNHGSRLSPGHPGQIKPRSLVETLNHLIDGALEIEHAQQPERDYIGMSELGDECLRRVYYAAVKAPRKPLTGSRLRIFEAGHIYEELAASWLRRAGFELLTHDHQGQEFRFTDGQISGGIDGVLIGGPDLPKLVYPALWENKSLGRKWWTGVVKIGVRLQFPKYYGQAQLYMAHAELPCCLWTAQNKDTCELYAEVIPFDLAEAQRFNDRGVEVVRAMQSGDPPARLCPNNSFFESKFCDFAEHCWKDSL